MGQPTKITKDKLMKTMNFLNHRNILAALAVFTAFHVEAQTWSNGTNSVTTYVTLESGKNYALQTNQIVKIVGVGITGGNNVS